jgi:DNA repair exonuclease SbcCD nuclease subunit
VFVYFTDLHAHNFPTCSVIGEDGVNSRLHDALGVIDQVCGYAVKHKIKTIVFGGDMFHDRKRIPVDVSSLVYKTWFRQVAKHSFDLHFLVGNHDRSASVPMETSLAPLSQIGRVYDRPTKVKFQGAYAGFIPYSENGQELRRVLKQFRGCRVIFMHQGVQGVVSRSGYALEGECLKKSDLALAPLILSGHIHEQQEVTRKGRQLLIYPGSCMQHDWGDVRSKKYFHVYDLSIMNRRHPKFHKQVETDAPRFVNLGMGDDPPADKNVFVRFSALSPDDLRHARKLSAALSASGVRYVAPPIVGPTSLTLPEEVEQTEPLLIGDMLSKYVAANVKGKKRRARLERVGKELLHEATST